MAQGEEEMNQVVAVTNPAISGAENRSMQVWSDGRPRTEPAPPLNEEQVAELIAWLGRDTSGMAASVAKLHGLDPEELVANQATKEPTPETTPHVARSVARRSKPTRPQREAAAARSGEGTVARRRKKAMPHVARSEQKVVKLSDYATCGVIPGNASNGRSKTAPQTGKFPVAKWFTFERVKISMGTVAYRYRWHQLIDPEAGIYRRMKPIYVRYLTDGADTVIRKKGNDVVKNLVKQWYEQKCGQAISAGEGVG